MWMLIYINIFVVVASFNLVPNEISETGQLGTTTTTSSSGSIVFSVKGLSLPL